MAEPAKSRREGRIKIEVQLKIADREALDRYCTCLCMNVTQFVTKRIREYERKILLRLTKRQREQYFAGTLLWPEMSEEEKDIFLTARPVVLGDKAQNKVPDEAAE